MTNPTTAIDFYKADHKSQYPEGTELVYSNWTPRSSRLAPVLPEYYDEKVVFFGLQAFMIDYLINEWNEKFFSVPKAKACKHFKRRMDTSLGPDMVTVTELEDLYDLGYLPLHIKALPEGSRVNIKVPMFTVQNSILGQFSYLVNFFESVISCEVWKPCTTATIAYEYRKILEKFAEQTGSPLEMVDIQAHDFSFRGMSGRKDASISGMGHLLSFVGTDTVLAIDAAEDFYFANADEELIGCSVPASEHSVMCMGGSGEAEIETFRRLIEDVYPTGIVSIVSDTWDFWKVITEYSVLLKDKIMARQPNALGLNKVVFRPDSGCPIDILCGTAIIREVSLEANIMNWADDVLSDIASESQAHGEIGDHKVECFIRQNGRVYKVTGEPSWNRYDKQYYYLDGVENIKITEHKLTPEEKGAVECLWDIFGGTITDQGFKLLDEHVGLIYGDSITLDRCNKILQRLADKGFGSTNVVFGVGAFTYQYLTRDTFGFAMKATYGEVNGEGREIYKDPKTDSGTKKSAKGLLRVEKENGNFVLYDQQAPEQEKRGLLQTVFLDGKLINPMTFADVRLQLKEV